MLTKVNRPPGEIAIPSAWRGEEMATNPDRWLILLSASEIAELERAAQSFLRILAAELARSYLGVPGLDGDERHDGSTRLATARPRFQSRRRS